MKWGHTLYLDGMMLIFTLNIQSEFVSVFSSRLYNLKANHKDRDLDAQKREDLLSSMLEFVTCHLIIFSTFDRIGSFRSVLQMYRRSVPGPSHNYKIIRLLDTYYKIKQTGTATSSRIWKLLRQVSQPAESAAGTMPLLPLGSLTKKNVISFPGSRLPLRAFI